MNSKTIVHYLRIILKSVFEFIPVFVFFMAFKVTHNFYTATFLLILVTISFTFYTFHREKRLPYIALFICFETTFFGSLTLLLRDPVYVQLRDTFYDLVLGVTMLITAILRKPIIKRFFGHIFDISLETWISLSYYWSAFLITFGLTNEYFRRNFPEFIWVRYKFIVMLITLAFGLFLLWKYRKNVKSLDL